MLSGREVILFEMDVGMQEERFGIRGSPLSCESAIRAIRKGGRMRISHRTRRVAVSFSCPCE